MRERLAQVGAIDSIARAGLVFAGGSVNRTTLKMQSPPITLPRHDLAR
jgi:hypothetical protein